MPPANSTDKTHFGFETVSLEEKTKKVAAVFHSVAPAYDLMNDLMSFGIHRIWKQLAIEMASVRPDYTILDLASGTGDLAIKMAPLLNDKGRLYVTDINPSMLKIAKEKMLEIGHINGVTFLQADAQCLPFVDNSFDLITIGFGLRNVTDKERALKSIYSALKPGGKLLILEFSQPQFPLLGKFYDFYSFNLLPNLGRFVAGDDKSYRYLAQSIRMHPNQDKLCHMMQLAGFENCQYTNLTGGIVAIHRGYKIV